MSEREGQSEIHIVILPKFARQRYLEPPPPSHRNKQESFLQTMPKTLFYLFSAKFFHHIHPYFYITFVITVKMAILTVLNLVIYFNSLLPTPSSPSSSSSLSPQRFPLISHRKSNSWTVSIKSRGECRAVQERGETFGNKKGNFGPQSTQ